LLTHGLKCYPYQIFHYRWSVTRSSAETESVCSRHPHLYVNIAFALSVFSQSLQNSIYNFSQCLQVFKTLYFSFVSTLNIMNMFKCDQCPSTFSRKDNLIRHIKNHDGLRFLCTVCPSTFSYKTGLNKHQKNAHGMYNNNNNINFYLIQY